MCQNTLRCIQAGNLLASPIWMQAPDLSHTLPRPTTRLKPFLKRNSTSGRGQAYLCWDYLQSMWFSPSRQTLFLRGFLALAQIYTVYIFVHIHSYQRWTVGAWNCHYICFARKRAKVSSFDDHHHSHDMTSGRMQKCLNLYLAENKRKLGCILLQLYI